MEDLCRFIKQRQHAWKDFAAQTRQLATALPLARQG
jgi:hypothetical protein